jgi:CO/xanthine dehydrogenase FAD-binding subunit
MKKTRMEKFDYPLVTLAAVKKENRIRVALSGVCAFPFRSPEMEDVLNDRSLAREERVRQALQRLPAPPVHNIHGSAGYRSFVLYHALVETLIQLEGLSA